ncbi:MAG: M20 family metallopeptidase [Ignavibacteriales bacterium]
MHGSSLLEYFQSRIPDMMHLAQKLVEHESPSIDREAVNRFSSWLGGVYRELGARVETIPGGQSGDNLRVEFGEGERQALILCHMDTVWPLGEVARRPFRVEGDRVSGPGIYDMKAGFLYTAEVFRAARHFGVSFPKRVVILCNSDEEIGSPSSRGVIEAEAAKSDYVLVLEPSAPGGAVKSSRKGQGTFHLRVRGVAAHSGSDHERGVSAIEELARHVLALQALTDYASGTTVNVGIVSGGTRSNVVAAEAHADIDVRVVSTSAMESVESAILGLKPTRQGISVEVTGGFGRPPMVRNEQTVRLYTKAKAIAAELGFDLPESATGAGSDGNFTAHLGVPTLDGLGAVGDGSHAVHEHMIVSALPQRISLLFRILCEF